MLDKKEKTIIYAMLPILFIIFLVGKIWQLLKEFWGSIQEGICESNSIL